MTSNDSTINVQQYTQNEDDDFKQLENKLQELIQNLGLDQNNLDQIFQEVWNNFKKLKQAYSLSDGVEWLAPLVLVACDRRKNFSRPVLSVLKLIRLSKINPMSLFSRSLKLSKMLNLPQGDQSSHAYARLNIARLLYQNYTNMFSNLFNIHFSDLSSLHNLGWLLFTISRNAYPQLTSDLVNSHHLLICLIHFFCVSVQSQLPEIVMSDLIGIDQLCRRFNGDPLQTKTVYEHFFRHQLSEFKNENGFVDLREIETIVQNVNAMYEKSLCEREETGGVIDERMFLTEDEVYKRKFSESENMTKPGLYWPPCLEWLNTVTDVNLWNSSVLSDDITEQDFKEIKNISEKFVEQLKNGFLEQFKIRIDLIDTFLDAVCRFFYLIFELVLISEKKRLGVEFYKNWKLLKGLQSLQKCLLICCFEVALNNCKITIPGSNKGFKGNNDGLTLLKTYLSANNDTLGFVFPWSLIQIQKYDISVTGYDLFRVVETFIRVGTDTYSDTQKFLLDRDCIKHLKRLEENLIEQVAWSNESSVWLEIGLLKIDLPEKGASFQSNTAFVWFEDVQSGPVGQSNTSCGELILNLAPNPSATAPAPHQPKHPVITRVIGINGETAQSTRVTSTQQNTRAQTSKRLLNLTPSLNCFFLKFYTLASDRLRRMLDVLDLNEFDKNLAITDQEISQINLQTTNDLILKTVWNLFELSLAPNHLLLNRHLDQLLLCSLYLACKLLIVNVTFTELIRIYKTVVNPDPRPYRHVLGANGQIIDLIAFYNQIFVPQLRPYALKLKRLALTDCNLPTIPSTTSDTLACLSPVPKTPISNSTHHFSPVKLGLSTSVFISPNSGNNIPSGPKTKITFTFGQPRPVQSLHLINTMIKKNELKLKVPSSNFNNQSEIDIKRLGPPSQTTQCITSVNKPGLSFLSSVVNRTRLTNFTNSPSTITMVVNNSSLNNGKSFTKKLQGIQNERKPD